MASPGRERRLGCPSEAPPPNTKTQTRSDLKSVPTVPQRPDGAELLTSPSSRLSLAEAEAIARAGAA
jgi:hypothetical protein